MKKRCSKCEYPTWNDNAICERCSPCVWCGQTFDEHVEARPDGAPVPRMPCLGLKDGYAATYRKWAITKEASGVQVSLFAPGGDELTLCLSPDEIQKFIRDLEHQGARVKE